MRTQKMTWLLVAIGIAFWPASSPRGAELISTITDKLGRPVEGVSFEVSLPQIAADGEPAASLQLELISNAEGVVRVDYDERRVPSDGYVRVVLSKPGYAGYSTRLRPDYVMERRFGLLDFGRLLGSGGDARRHELRELLAGDFDRDGTGSLRLQELVFQHEHELRADLRSLIRDPHVGKEAIRLLAFIGDPEDLRLIVESAPEPKRELFEDRWAYDVVSALLSPGSDAEWTFLRRCALNDFDDLWVDGGAIKTLMLIGTPRSVEILKEVQEKNEFRRDYAAHALKQIESGPPPLPLASTNLVEAARKTAQAIRIGNWEGNKDPRFNERGDKALIDCEFIAGRDLLIHTATFHKVGDQWMLRGVRETLQALLAGPPDKSDYVGAWHGYSDHHLEFARLELDENGTGLLAISFLPDSPPEAYRITWSQRGFGLEVELKPVDTDAEQFSIQNLSLGVSSLELELVGSAWTRKLTLFNEASVQERADRLRDRLKQLRGEE